VGDDFLRKTAKSYRKSQDKARAELATSDLLTRNPDKATCTAPFDMAPRAKLNPGERVTVEPAGAQLVARQGLNEVARARAPSASVLKAVQDSCGIASGKIEQVHDEASVTEISIC
jgi:hypothetical protein